MQIRKIGHCCLVIEVNGKMIMTDPGGWTTEQVDERGLDLILITHEHGDHLHVESLKEVLQNNPNCKVITNSSVARILSEQGIAAGILEDGELDFEGINIFAKTCKHAEMYKSVTPVQNTGYMIGDELFYPGDAFLEIDRKVEILAAPITAPWSKISEVIDYILKVKPKKAIKTSQ